MGYHVDYAPAATKQSGADSSLLRIILMSAAFFLAFCLVVSALWPRGREVLGNLLFPGGAEPAMEAAEVFVDELRNGEPISDALNNFCRDILNNADLP